MIRHTENVLCLTKTSVFETNNLKKNLLTAMTKYGFWIELCFGKQCSNLLHRVRVMVEKKVKISFHSHYNSVYSIPRTTKVL